MKYLLVVLSVSMLLLGCADADGPVSIGDTASEAEATSADSSEADDSTETSDSEGDSDSEGTDTEETEVDEDEDKDEDKDTKDEKDTEGVNQKNVKLVVTDQKTAGQIIVEEVATSRDGWVSVHVSQEDGSITLPDDIGKTRVNSGTSEEVIIDLWEAPAVGDKLWVLLHIDAGERGQYEFPEKDLPVKKNGDTMARDFKVLDSEEKEEEEEEEAEDE